MNLAAKVTGFVCVILTIALWAVTLMGDATPGSVAAAIALTAIVALVGALSLR